MDKKENIDRRKAMKANFKPFKNLEKSANATHKNEKTQTHEKDVTKKVYGRHQAKSNDKVQPKNVAIDKDT